LQGKRAFCDRGNTNLNHEIRAKAGARVPFGRHLKIDKQTNTYKNKKSKLTNQPAQQTNKQTKPSKINKTRQNQTKPNKHKTSN